MKSILTEFNHFADEYFDTAFEDRTLDKAIDFLSKTLRIVQSNSANTEEFEDINLKTQEAMNIPEKNEGYEFLQDVREELLGYEDLEVVLGSKQKAIEGIHNWCGYIQGVIYRAKST